MRPWSAECEWIREIRDRVGNKMDIAVDLLGAIRFHQRQRIAKALEPYNIMYLEDAMLSEQCAELCAAGAETSVPICMSETLATTIPISRISRSQRRATWSCTT